MLNAHPDLLEAHVFGEETALHFHAVENRVDVVRWLIDQGANPDPSTFSGTPLIEAASLGHLEMCRVLVAAGADINARCDAMDETPLIAACRQGCLPLIAYFLYEGARVNETLGRRTAWDEALPRKAEDIRKLLEKYGGYSARNLPEEIWCEEDASPIQE